MSASELAKKIKYWAEFKFCDKVLLYKTSDCYLVEFETRTTMSRASSMVTRIRLIAQDASSSTKVYAGKKLVSEPPAAREDLASWIIFVVVPIRGRPRIVDHLCCGPNQGTHVPFPS